MPDTSAPRRSPLVLAILLCAILTSTVGCRSMWDAQRENERMFALDAARTHANRGQCDKALGEIDRAQSRIDLGAYSRESVLARLRCYEKLGMTELASAHRRLVADFYTDEPMAYPDPDGSSIFRVRTISKGGYDRPPAWLKISAPRYPEFARRSRIIGRVVVAFELAGNDRPRSIRVLEMPHPLLATWAIEAITQAKGKKKKNAPELIPGGRYVTTFLFEYRWAKELPSEPLDS
ncbi:MAG: energy transducer TonB [Myxococcota bacterium]